jgi:hypothetical protein
MEQQQSLSSWRGAIVLLILVAFCVPCAYAQLAVTMATLSGTVTDPSGALISRANVTITSQEKGITRTFTTGPQGQYSFSLLPPSTYQLAIQAKGFEEYIQKGILLDAGQAAHQDVSLRIGNISEQMTVTGQASLLNTDNANISADIDSKQLVELPLNMRNIYGLATLNSSVNNSSENQSMLAGGTNTTDNADQDASFLHFSGGFFGTTAFLLDGAWNTDAEWGGVIYVPSVDAVQEFKLQNNSFTAQYGWSTGNVINVVTKSGTNAFHGSAYEFYRNSALDANLWFADHNDVPKSSYNRNQAGISAGGPLYIPGLYEQREKTFIFGTYEHFGVANPSVAYFTVPDSRERAGDFSELLGPQVGTDALGRPILSGQIYDPLSAYSIGGGAYIRNPISGNILSNAHDSYYDPNGLGAKLMGYFPKATSDTATANNLVTSGNSPASSNEYLVRVDHNISNVSRIFFRYSYKQENKTFAPAYYGSTNPAGPGNIANDNRYNLSADYSRVFSQTFLINVAAGVGLWHEKATVQSAGFHPSSLGLPAYLDDALQFPYIQMGNYAPIGNSGGGDSLTNHGPVGSVAVDFTKLAGKHTMSFGFMGVELQADQTSNYSTSIIAGGSFTAGPDPFNPTGNTGNGLAQALLGNPANPAGVSGFPDGGSAGISYNPVMAIHRFGWYLQDDWRAQPKLTLNLGIRYEIQTAPTVRHNLGSVFDPNAINPIGAQLNPTMTLPGELQFLSSSNRGAYNTNYDNFAPRIGFSYQPTPKLAFRGGYGIFYTPSSNNLAAMASFDGYSPSTQVTASVNGGLTPIAGLSLSNPWPGGFIPVTGNSLGALQDLGYGINGSDFRKRASSYVQQGMFGLQYAFTPSDSLELDYVANNGTHLPDSGQNRDQLNPKYLLQYTASQLNALVPNPFYGVINFNAGASPCGLDQTTVVQAQLLSPYPQYCAVGEALPPVGSSTYNALQVNYKHRFHSGLNVLVNYTYSKFLDNVEGNQTWAYVGNQGTANNYNLAAEKSVDAGDVTHSLVASYVYDLPIGRGKTISSHFNRATDAVLGGWEVSGNATFKSGIPIAVSGNNIDSFGGNPRPDVIGDVHASHPNINEWFNTAAFAYAAYGTFGTAPRYFSGLRAPGYKNFDTAIMKNWTLMHGTRLQFRAEMFNTFNHPNFYAPNGSYGGCDPNADSNCPSGFGQITSAFASREIQFGGKFYW